MGETQFVSRIIGVVLLVAMAALAGQIFEPQLSYLAIAVGQFVSDHPSSVVVTLLVGMAAGLYAAARVVARIERTRLG